MGCDRKGALTGADWGGWPSSFLDFIGGERHVHHNNLLNYLFALYVSIPVFYFTIKR